MNIVVLTGAGLSQESGLPTFRGAGGWWQGHQATELATPQAFARNPKLVLDFYNERRRKLQSPEIQPNAAHFALAQFQSRPRNGTLTLVTQNVDDLLERAGCRNVIHMHGELLKARSLDTDEVFDWRDDIDVDTPHPGGGPKSGRLRPHIVWFGEQPLHLVEIFSALTNCDLFIAIGTSGVVWPAAGFVQEVPKRCRCVELNMEETPVSSYFHEQRLGPASQIVPEFLSTLDT
ncbi:MAG TPA: NAD-dependent deacylase [Pirellulaceae bacterium]|nr:NAD-dependent deacylase [Pirellulaceae bacterium]HMO93307.1 NAD-dependent deacylase [Pirellulaceae bacterium]HMP69154.1 NAD-dependent deacylase [Pirellulaceae bacterium]